MRVGSSAYTVANTGTTVKADYEVEILEPEPVLNLHWKVISRYREVLSLDTALTLSAFGAAANSARAKSAALKADIGKGAIREAPLAVVDPGTLVEMASVVTGPHSSEAIAGQTARASGGIVVEAFEVDEMNETVYRFLPWSRRGLSAALPAAIDGAPLPARPKVTIDVVVGGGAGPVNTTRRSSTARATSSASTRP